MDTKLAIKSFFSFLFFHSDPYKRNSSNIKIDIVNRDRISRTASVQVHGVLVG